MSMNTCRKDSFKDGWFVDDECAVCGTINMDYRSFYLQSMNVFTCESSAVADIRDDIHETLKQCQEIYLDEWQSRPWYEKIVQWILHLFAPVLNIRNVMVAASDGTDFHEYGENGSLR